MDQPDDVAMIARQMGQLLAEVQATHAEMRAVIATVERVEENIAGLVAEMQAARA